MGRRGEGRLACQQDPGTRIRTVAHKCHETITQSFKSCVTPCIILGSRCARNILLDNCGKLYFWDCTLNLSPDVVFSQHSRIDHQRRQVGSSITKDRKIYTSRSLLPSALARAFVVLTTFVSQERACTAIVVYAASPDEVFNRSFAQPVKAA